MSAAARNVPSTRSNLPSRIRAIPRLMAADWPGGFVTARLPRHLKLPTRPGEELADVLYNRLRDFLFPPISVPYMGVLSLGLNATPTLSCQKQFPSSSSVLFKI